MVKRVNRTCHANLWAGLTDNAGNAAQALYSCCNVHRVRIILRLDKVDVCLKGWLSNKHVLGARTKEEPRVVAGISETQPVGDLETPVHSLLGLRVKLKPQHGARLIARLVQDVHVGLVELVIATRNASDLDVGKSLLVSCLDNIKLVGKVIEEDSEILLR